MSDAYNLHRFLTTQAPTYNTVLADLRAEGKPNHWIWFIVPQIADLEFANKVGLKRFSVNPLEFTQDTFR